MKFKKTAFIAAAGVGAVLGKKIAKKEIIII